MSWKKIPRHWILQKGVSLLRTKSRDNVGTENTVDWPPDRPGKVDSFHGLIVNFYSLRTKKIPAGRLVLGDWLKRNRVFTEWASLLNWESGSLLVTIRGLWARLQRGSVSFRGDLDSGFCFHFRVICAKPHTCGLQQSSTTSFSRNRGCPSSLVWR